MDRSGVSIERVNGKELSDQLSASFFLSFFLFLFSSIFYQVLKALFFSRSVRVKIVFVA